MHLAALLGALLAGLLAGKQRSFFPQVWVERLTSWTLYLLILAMGFRIGRTEEVATGFARIGLAAMGYASATVIGTVLALWPLFSLFSRSGSLARRTDFGEKSAPARPSGGPLRRRFDLWAAPLKLLGILGLGLLIGRLIPPGGSFTGASAANVLLYGLLFLIGISVRRSGFKPRELLDSSLWILPLGTMTGSLAGGLALALVLGQRAGRGLALAAGFGWYSLSGVLLIQLDGPALGATAFLANLMRESLSLLLIPLLARTRFPFLAIGVGGATSMDVTLPLIEIHCGPRAVPFAIASGAVLSVLVPVLVPLLYPLG